MSRARIVRSASNATLEAAALDFLTLSARESEVVVIAPSRIAADELVRRACDSRGLLGAHRFTLRQLTSALSRNAAAERGLAPISRLGMEALAARVAHLLLRDNQLPYFEPVADTPGFARALARTLSEARLQRARPAALAETGAPGSDLARLLTLFEQELEFRGLADYPLLLELATSALRQGKHRLSGLPVLLASVRIENDAERSLIAALCGRSPAVLACVLQGDESCLEYKAILAVSPENIGKENRFLDTLRAQLFSTQSLIEREIDAESLEIFSAPGESLECVEIARRATAAARSGVAFDRMAVLLRQSERYQPLLEEAFRRAGIPAYFTRGTARPNGAGRALLALLDCAAEGCSASKFAEYLSLGQVPRAHSSPAETDWTPPADETLADYSRNTPEPAEIDEPPASDASAVIAGTLQAPAGWEKLLVDAAVVGGAHRWERRLKGLRESLGLEASLEEDGDIRSRIERQIQQLQTLESFALPIIRLLHAFSKDANWGEWLVLLESLARMSLRKPESVLAALAEMQPLAGVGPVGLREVREVLSERLRFLRDAPPARRYGRVWVGGIEEARSMCFPIVFLPGLAEGVFPLRAIEDPLLLDEYRGSISGLPMNEQRTAGERLLLRSAAAAAEDRFVVSYPRMDVVEARSRVPSFYALEVVRAATGSLPELAGFGRHAASGSTALLGWPAPADPEHAIDDAEFDIATLRRCLSLPAHEAKGRARYLIEIDTTLSRTLRNRYRRWGGAWSPSDGMVNPGAESLSILADSRLSAKSYSASSLQHFALCPYRFLMHAIHRLRPAEKPAALEQMDPLTRGSLFHAAQFELLRRLEADHLLPVTEQRLGEVLRRADEVFDRVAAEFEDRLAPAIPRVWKSEVDQLRADLHGWLRIAATAQGNWVPYRFEFAFGLKQDDSRDPRSTMEEAVILERFRMRGSIDLIERQTATGKLRITDHKTGKVADPRPVSIGGGTALQPVLYGLAAEMLLGAQVESGRLYHCTQRGNYTPVEIPLNDRARERARLTLHTIDDAIEQGFLPAAPAKGACLYCDYRPVCGPHEEERVRNKAKERLEALNELRSQP